MNYSIAITPFPTVSPRFPYPAPQLLSSIPAHCCSNFRLVYAKHYRRHKLGPLPGCGGGGNSSEETTNNSPTVDAGADQTVANGSTVSLTASAADDGAPTIEWSQTSGTTLSLWSATTEKTAFTAAEELVFEISVDDGVNAAVTDSVTITVEPDTVAQQGMDPSLVLSLVEAVITESCTL